MRACKSRSHNCSSDLKPYTMKMFSPAIGNAFSLQDHTPPINHLQPRDNLPQSVYSENGTFLFQRMMGTYCQICYTACNIQRDLKIDGAYEHYSLTAVLALQEEGILLQEKTEPICLYERQFNLLYSPTPGYQQSFKAGKDYIYLIIRYPLHLLEEWLTFFPFLRPFIQKIHAGQPARLLTENGSLTTGIMNIVTRMLHDDNCQPPARSLYLENCCRDLLFLLLQQAGEQVPKSQFNYQDVLSIHKARDFIVKNIRYHFSIRQIAIQTGTNEFKLKKGFRELFGAGIYEYLQTERMEKARRLLQETDKPLKEIFLHAGYKSQSSFIKAFKKTFGCLPGAYRRNPVAHSS